MDGPIDVERVCALLKDPEIDVPEQGDRCHHQGEPSGHDPLPDRGPEGRERERATRGRRGAERGSGNARSVKYLLEALKDSDWWVRSRAADALGKIGGPKVIDADPAARPR